MEIMDILEMIENRRISFEEGINLIHEVKNKSDLNNAKWIKIKIIDKKENVKINLPSIPIGLATSLISLGIKMGIKHSEKKTIRYGDIKKMLNILKTMPSVNLISINDEKGTEVEIYTK